MVSLGDAYCNLCGCPVYSAGLRASSTAEEGEDQARLHEDVCDCDGTGDFEGDYEYHETECSFLFGYSCQLVSDQQIRVCFFLSRSKVLTEWLVARQGSDDMSQITVDGRNSRFRGLRVGFSVKHCKYIVFTFAQKSLLTGLQGQYDHRGGVQLGNDPNFPGPVLNAHTEGFIVHDLCYKMLRRVHRTTENYPFDLQHLYFTMRASRFDNGVLDWVVYGTNSENEKGFELEDFHGESKWIARIGHEVCSSSHL